MSFTLDVHGVDPYVLAAAREYIRSQGDACIVSMSELIDELKRDFGERFHTEHVLDLIETLWADPHIDQVPDTGWVEFAWNERGR
jgi:hypothetical protein